MLRFDETVLGERLVREGNNATRLPEPAPTRVLLRSLETGLYYRGAGVWVTNPKAGYDFGCVECAARAYWWEGLTKVVVALWTEEPECELRLPVPGRGGA